MKTDEIVDLYEIIVYVECDGVRARIYKYPTKRTDKNFLPLVLTDELEVHGYSHRMSGRVPVEDLNKLQRCGGGDSCDHVWRHAYCLVEDREKVFNNMRADIDSTIRRFRDRTQELLATWDKNGALLKPEAKKPRAAPKLTDAGAGADVADMV